MCCSCPALLFCPILHDHRAVETCRWPSGSQRSKWSTVHWTLLYGRSRMWTSSQRLPRRQHTRAVARPSTSRYGIVPVRALLGVRALNLYSASSNAWVVQRSTCRHHGAVAAVQAGGDSRQSRADAGGPEDDYVHTRPPATQRPVHLGDGPVYLGNPDPPPRSIEEMMAGMRTQEVIMPGSGRISLSAGGGSGIMVMGPGMDAQARGPRLAHARAPAASMWLGTGPSSCVQPPQSVHLSRLLKWASGKILSPMQNTLAMISFTMQLAY